MKFYEKFTANFDETAANEKGIENLCNRKPVSFDVIKPSLIFFNDDGQALSIISTCSPDSEEERELTKLLNFQNPNEPKFWDKLTNYKDLDRKGFLDKIKSPAEAEPVR